MNLKDRTDSQFYRLGKWIWLPAIVFGLLVAFFLYPKVLSVYPIFGCKFKQVTHLPCPGCGGTRAFVSLFKGDIWGSFCYNPTVVYCLLAYIHFMALYFIRLHITKTIYNKIVHVSYYFVGLAIVIIGQWIVKLIIIFFIR